MNKLILSGVAVAALAVPALAQMAMHDRHASAPQTRAQAEAKVREHFGMMDANKDGVVAREEIRASVDAMMAKHQGAAFDALDTDKNGSLSREEFAARGPGAHRIVMRMREDKKPADAAAKGDKPGHGEHRMMMHRHGGPGGGMMLMMADTDKDGRISIDDAVKATLAKFDAADANRDGTLTPEERKAARATKRAEWRAKVG